MTSAEAWTLDTLTMRQRGLADRAVPIWKSDFSQGTVGKGKYPHLLGSKWTATSDIFGWRHFLVTNRKNEGDMVFAEMKSACGPDVRFWVNAKALKDRRLWLPGWVLLAQLHPTESEFSQ